MKCYGNLRIPRAQFRVRNIASSTYSVRGLYHYQDDYSGSDPRYNMALNINLVPTVDPDLRGGELLDLAVGLNWVLPDGHRLALEYQRPVWQKLNGPQHRTSLWPASLA